MAKYNKWTVKEEETINQYYPNKSYRLDQIASIRLIFPTKGLYC
jgi:hypothetical protein